MTDIYWVGEAALTLLVVGLMWKFFGPKKQQDKEDRNDDSPSR